MESKPEITVSRTAPSAEALRRSELFRSEKQALLRMAHRLTGNAEDARDLVQEVEIGILVHRTGPRDDDCFRAWCQGILRNKAFQFLRSAARRVETRHLGLEDAENHADTSVASLDAGLEARRLVQQTQALEAQDLELLVRRFVLEQNSTEIAHEFSSSPAAVRMKLKRLLRRIRTGAGNLTNLGGLGYGWIFTWVADAAELMHSLA